MAKITPENDLEIRRKHSGSHIMTAAVQKIYGDSVGLGVGPWTDEGFYQDFDFGATTLAENDLAKIEKEMGEIVKKNLPIIKVEMNADEARKICKGDPYKTELVEEIIARGDLISFYYIGESLDKAISVNLCAGPHLEKTGELGAFKLMRIAGAYWRGDEKNKMLTRIYGIAFPTQEELDAYLKQREEAEKRDHKKIGKEMGLFTVSDLVGKGLPMYLPKGNIIRTELENFIRHEKEALGYSFVTIPHIAKKELYIRSGHLGKYDAMMPIMKDENGEEFVLKAMNCPHHFELYNAQPHSYKDLPFRIAENTVVYRNEKSGELSGLLRVKGLCQDDTHHVIRLDQIESEIKMIHGLMQKVYSIFGFDDYKVEISIRDPKNKEKYFGSDEVWQNAENILIEQVKTWGVPFSIEEGEAAFYGPKIDIRVKDCIGREWQLTTIQLDFNQPENFDMDYTGEDGKKHRVVVLHVAIFGSFERFFGILIEHYAGAFPLWLSPTQVKVLSVSEKHAEYAKEVVGELKAAGIRAETDDSNESLGKKIRAGKMEKVPYLLVVGDKEVEAKTVSVESRDAGKLDINKLDDFIVRASEEIKNKK